MKLDLLTRCARCRKIPRGKMQKENYERYKPYCSYNCQEWHRVEEARRHILEFQRAAKTLRPDLYRKPR